MSFLSHHTLEKPFLQETQPTDPWHQEIVPLLPKDLEEYAWRLGATARKGRKIQKPSDILRGILVYTLCSSSLKDLASWGVLSDIADMAGTSWRDRVRKSSRWMNWLLSDLIQPEKQEPCPHLKKAGYGSIELVDASHWTCIGKKGEVWRFHCMYSLLTQQLHQVMVTSTQVSESIARFTLESGNIYVHDGGYGYRGEIAQTIEAGAYSVSAFCPATFPLEDANGKAIDVVAWLKQQRAREGSVKGFTAFFWEKGKRYEVRVVGLRRNKVRTKKILQQKRKKAVRNKRNLQKETEYLAGWLLTITTLPAKDWSAQEILSLYRARWQIEIFFKRIKQLLDQHDLRVKTDEMAQSMVTAILVSWVLQQEVAVEIRSLLKEMYQNIEVQQKQEEEEGEKVMQVLSEWRLQKVSVLLFLQNIQGPLTRQRILECLPTLQRHLGDSPRKRTHQWSRVTQYLVDTERDKKTVRVGKNRNTGSTLTSALA